MNPNRAKLRKLVLEILREWQINPWSYQEFYVHIHGHEFNVNRSSHVELWRENTLLKLPLKVLDEWLLDVLSEIANETEDGKYKLKEEFAYDEEDVEITNVQSPADRTAEAQRKAEAEGKVIDIDQDSGAEETKQDEDGNTIDHAQGNELGDMLEAQNLAEHLAAEEILELELAELEGDLGLLVTGDRDTFERILNKIIELNAYERFQHYLDSAEEHQGTIYKRLHGLCRSYVSVPKSKRCDYQYRMDELKTFRPKKKRVRPPKYRPCGKCTTKMKYCRCPASPLTLPSYELPTSDDEHLKALLLEPTNLRHWDAFRSRNHGELRRAWSELLRVIQCLRLFVNQSGNVQYAELLKMLQKWADENQRIQFLSKYKNMGVEPSEFSAEIDARLSSALRSTTISGQPTKKRTKKNKELEALAEQEKEIQRRRDELLSEAMKEDDNDGGDEAEEPAPTIPFEAQLDYLLLLEQRGKLVPINPDSCDPKERYGPFFRWPDVFLSVAEAESYDPKERYGPPKSSPTTLHIMDDGGKDEDEHLAHHLASVDKTRNNPSSIVPPPLSESEREAILAECEALSDRPPDEDLGLAEAIQASIRDTYQSAGGFLSDAQAYAHAMYNSLQDMVTPPQPELTIVISRARRRPRGRKC